MYGGDGDDVLQGGPGANYFDCGSGFDIIVGFDPAKGDTNANNCEDEILIFRIFFSRFLKKRF